MSSKSVPASLSSLLSSVSGKAVCLLAAAALLAASLAAQVKAPADASKAQPAAEGKAQTAAQPATAQRHAPQPASFDNSPISDLSRFERQATGEWSVENGRIVQNDDVGLTVLLAGDRSWGTYSVSARVRVTKTATNSEAGLLLQFTDPDNFLVFSVRNRKGVPLAVLRIVRKKPQMSIVVDQARLSSGTDNWHELRADVRGVDVVGYVDGKDAVSYSFLGTPPPYNTHGKTWDPDPTTGWTGLMSNDATAEYANFRVAALPASRVLVTPQRGRWDSRGHLLPRQSYSETMRLYTDWLDRSGTVVDTSKAPEAIRSLQTYLLSNFSTSDDQLLGLGGEHAFNHALLISGAVQYYIYTGNREYLGMAEKTADFEMEHSTTPDYAWPYMAPSVVSFKKDGSWEGQDWGLEPDKSAYMGYAYLKLYVADGQQKYLDAAQKIASTLSKHQGPAGDWPFRVNAKTGEVKHGYTCSQLWYVWFFEKLADVTGDRGYLKYRDKAFQWLLDNPIKTNKWTGLYGDIPSNVRSFDQWVAQEAAIYLIDHRNENSSYVKTAKGILDWLNRFLVVDYGFFPRVPGIVEQSSYKVVLTHHELRLAETYAKLWEATGDAKYKDLAVQIANSVTWNLMSDGKMRQGYFYHAWGIPLVISFNDQFTRVMACIPETAPKGENHILQTSTFVKDVRYDAKEVTYKTVAASEDAVKLASAPKSVLVEGKELQPAADPNRATGWRYDKATGLLRLNHGGGQVRLVLQ